jgi:hypothetical protein
MESILGTLS